MQEMQGAHRQLITLPGGPPPPGAPTLTGAAIAGIVTACVLVLIAAAVVVSRCACTSPALATKMESTDEVCTLFSFSRRF
jgi:hypothetical protein